MRTIVRRNVQAYVLYSGPGSGHDQFARHHFRPCGIGRSAGAEGIHADISRGRAGSSMIRTKSGRPNRRRCRGDRPRRDPCARDIAAIGITNQRETTVVWDRAQRRAASQCHRVAGPPHRGVSATAQGARATKRWSRAQNRPGARCLFLRHQARMDARQCSRCARGARAGRTGIRHGGQLADLEALRRRRARHRRQQRFAHAALQYPRAADWDDELLRLFDVPREVLPRVVPSSGVVGETRRRYSLPRASRSPGIAGDQQAALFGQRCITPGMVKNTYGTGCFMLMHTGGQPVSSRTSC